MQVKRWIDALQIDVKIEFVETDIEHVHIWFKKIQ